MGELLAAFIIRERQRGNKFPETIKVMKEMGWLEKVDIYSDESTAIFRELLERYGMSKAMQDDDYRDEHSPDIALLLTLARTFRKRLAADMTATETAELDKALKAFEDYPPPAVDDC
jgi:hypothetical protein